MVKAEQKPIRTVLSEIIASLAKAAEYNRNDQVAPTAILWTDKERQWEALAPLLRAELPQFLTLGNYDPAAKTGPAIWLRCMIGRTLPEADWPASAIPILYLPDVSRQELRAIENCPRHLHPLAGIQYSCAFWSHVNGKDWTITAFLQAKEGGLGLDIAGDNATKAAAKLALVKLAETPLSELRGRRLEAADFNELLAPDPIKNLLMWLNDPDGMRQAWPDAQWAVFCNQCRQDYDFDPEKDGSVAGGEKLALAEGKWEGAWARFAESPTLYANIPELLSRTKTAKGGLFAKRERWPQFNAEMEKDLRGDLKSLRSMIPEKARERLLQLGKEHGVRRGWVWAKLNLAPLATALEPLTNLARHTQEPPKGATLDQLADSHAEHGWRADAAALDAMAVVSKADDVEAVKAAIAAVYAPWLESAAERFQEVVAGQPLPGKDAAKHGEPKAGTCIVFADGLRFDVAMRLAAAMEQDDYTVEVGRRWAAMPTVTPTAKPAASPVADALAAGQDPGQFCPALLKGGQQLTIERFRKLLGDRNVQVLSPADVGDPKGIAWTEHGQIDRRGHDEGFLLSRRIAEEIQSLAERIVSLLEAGWLELRVVTDHGWLLLPSGLPVVEMPKFLVETRWGRCAVLKPGSKTDLPTVPWHWDSGVTIAVAPGIACFRAGSEYSHGGLSLQECLLPELTVRVKEGQRPKARIEAVRWVNMRCYITTDQPSPALRADIRTKAADPKSSLCSGGKCFGDARETALLVENDALAGVEVAAVLVDETGKVIAKQSTTVCGGE